MGIKNIEDLVNMIQQIQLLNSLQNDMSYGQLPDYLMKDRSVKQGEVSQDSLFNSQGANISNSFNGNLSSLPIELPESDRPSQENIPITFSDFFGNPQYNYEESIMMPKKDDIDD
tara:strand:+ start:37 stop:381 length:345 start_codon:yes stop_codon:yes gene_type:complete